MIGSVIAESLYRVLINAIGGPLSGPLMMGVDFEDLDSGSSVAEALPN